MYEKIWLSETIPKYRRVVFDLIDNSNHWATINPTPLTGVKARLSAQGVDVADSTADIVAMDSTHHPGRHYVELTQAELTTLGHGQCGLYLKPSGCDPCPVDFFITDYDPKVDGATTTAITAAVLAGAAAAPIAAEIKKVNGTTLGAHAGTAVDPFGP